MILANGMYASLNELQDCKWLLGYKFPSEDLYIKPEIDAYIRMQGWLIKKPNLILESHGVSRVIRWESVR